MTKINFNVPKVPSIASVPNNSQAAWINGYVSAAKNGERIIANMMCFLDVSAKALIVNKYKELMEVTETTNSGNVLEIRRRKKVLSCKHASKYIEQTYEGNQYFCTICGERG